MNLDEIMKWVVGEIFEFMLVHSLFLIRTTGKWSRRLNLDEILKWVVGEFFEFMLVA